MGVGFALPIFEFALVDAAVGEKVNDVHEKLFIGLAMMATS